MPRPPRSPEAFFWAFFARFERADCWLWTGAQDNDGYGVVRVPRTLPWIRPPAGIAYVHRVAWGLLRYPLAPGRDLDHTRKCSRLCGNPDHLRDRTATEHRRETLIQYARLDPVAERLEEAAWRDEMGY